MKVATAVRNGEVASLMYALMAANGAPSRNADGAVPASNGISPAIR